jgi:hypothetical protein
MKNTLNLQYFKAAAPLPYHKLLGWVFAEMGGKIRKIHKDKKIVKV